MNYESIVLAGIVSAALHGAACIGRKFTGRYSEWASNASKPAGIVAAVCFAVLVLDPIGLKLWSLPHLLILATTIVTACIYVAGRQTGVDGRSERPNFRRVPELLAGASAGVLILTLPLPWVESAELFVPDQSTSTQSLASVAPGVALSLLVLSATAIALARTAWKSRDTHQRTLGLGLSLIGLVCSGLVLRFIFHENSDAAALLSGIDVRTPAWIALAAAFGLLAAGILKLSNTSGTHRGTAQAALQYSGKL